MAFITGLLLIDAPASALNNSGDPIDGARTDNTSSTKFIRTRQGLYPYVSAQAFRFWLRNTLAAMPDTEWKMSPIGRETKVAYTDANPLDWWDDDLFGYMRAPSKKKDKDMSELTPIDEKSDALTRSAPFRVSTFVSLEPVFITNDFGVMARQDGDPVPYEHQFYRAVLRGLFSLDLRMAGTFTSKSRVGFKNLDRIRQEAAQERGLEPDEDGTYRLPFDQRVARVQALLKAVSRVHGGAKQTLHYTDVTPSFVMLGVTRGGNHPFVRVVSSERGEPFVHQAALKQVFDAFEDDLLSGVYAGRAEGFMDSSAETLAEFNFPAMHPRQAFEAISAEIASHPEWWE